MPTASKKRAISYSQLSAFETCPKQYFHTTIRKDVKRTESAQMREGKAVHRALERFVKHGAALPTTLNHLLPIMEEFRAVAKTEGIEVCVERQLAITEQMAECEWFGPDVWMRAIVDLALIAGTRALVIDYKTGKPKADPDFTQLKLAAAMLAIPYPQIETWDVGFLWTVNGERDGITISKADLTGVWNDVLPRDARLQSAVRNDAFPANPSGLCRGWCPVMTCPYYEGR